MIISFYEKFVIKKGEEENPMYVKPTVKAVQPVKKPTTPMAVGCAPCRGRNSRSTM